jgi:hypothetical protein
MTEKEKQLVKEFLSRQMSDVAMCRTTASRKAGAKLAWKTRKENIARRLIATAQEK